MPPIVHPRRYLWTLLGLTGVALLAIVSFNVLTDPFRVFGTPRRAGLNDRVPNTSGFDRMSKPYELLRAMPRTVLLGSSTAHSGFLSLAEWNTVLPRPAYNYALLGANAHEVRLSLAQALRECPVEAVIMVADFFAFNAHYRDNERFDPTRLPAATRGSWPGFLGSDLAAFVLGREALGLSWQTVAASRRAQRSREAVSPSWQNYSWHVHFRNCERSYLAKWFPAPTHRYQLASTETGEDRLADFDAVLRLSAERGVRLIVLCPPIHARFQEALATAGAWPQYEAWKRELARRTRAQQARPSGPGAVELWDFSLFNDATCEAVPADGAGPMRYFFDSAHFTTEFGRIVLDEILEGIPRLGVRLDQADIEVHLAGLRSDLHRFRLANPGVVADVRAALGIPNGNASPLSVSALEF